MPCSFRRYGRRTASLETWGCEATYKIYQYLAVNTAVPDDNWPTTLAGSSGLLRLQGDAHDSVGVFTVGNPRVYGDAVDGYDPTMTNSTGYLGLWKVELVSGGPIQVHAGGDMTS